MIEYWHWHTTHFGTETYWVGVLPHDQQPGRVYAELSRLGAEFRRRGRAGRRPDARRRGRSAVLGPLQVGARVPGRVPEAGQHRGRPRRTTSTSGPTTGSSRPSTAARSRPGFPPACCTTARSSARTASLLDPAALAAELPVLIVPGLLVADDELLWLAAGVRARPAATSCSGRAPRTGTRRVGRGPRSSPPTWPRWRACATRSSPTSPTPVAGHRGERRLRPIGGCGGRRLGRWPDHRRGPRSSLATTIPTSASSRQW